GDPLFSMWRVGWVAHQIATDPLHLFDANIFYPQGLTLTLSDPVILPALTIAPLLAVGVHPVVAYNILFLSGFWLSGVATYLLVERLTGSARAAFVAGLTYACYSYRFEHYSHLELQMTQWMPLGLLGLHQFLATGRRLYAVAFGLAGVAQLYSSMYYAAFFLVYATVVGLGLLRIHRPPMRPLAAPLAIAAAIAAVLAVPITWAFVAAEPIKGARGTFEVEFYSAYPSDFLRANRSSLLWNGRLRPPAPAGTLRGAGRAHARHPGGVRRAARAALASLARVSTGDVRRARRVRDARRVAVVAARAGLDGAAAHLRRVPLRAGRHPPRDAAPERRGLQHPLHVFLDVALCEDGERLQRVRSRVVPRLLQGDGVLSRHAQHRRAPPTRRHVCERQLRHRHVRVAERVRRAARRRAPRRTLPADVERRVERAHGAALRGAPAVISETRASSRRLPRRRRARDRRRTRRDRSRGRSPSPCRSRAASPRSRGCRARGRSCRRIRDRSSRRGRARA